MPRGTLPEPAGGAPLTRFHVRFLRDVLLPEGTGLGVNVTGWRAGDVEVALPTRDAGTLSVRAFMVDASTALAANVRVGVDVEILREVTA